MKPNCANCRYFFETRPPYPLYMALCTHPGARLFSRINGEYAPRFDKPTDEGDETLKKCDENGWFEEKKLWWRFWRAA